MTPTSLPPVPTAAGLRPDHDHRRRWRRPTATAAGLVAVLGSVACQPQPPAPAATPAPVVATPVSTRGPAYTYARASDPARTVVTLAGSWVATFTDGARTVTLAGPKRTFSEPGVAATVTSTTWVRVLPSPFSGTVDASWLTTQSASTAPDVLAQSLQYVKGAPVLLTGTVPVAGDAHYGPLDDEGKAIEGSDFNDYLGVAWTYGGTKDQPEVDQLRSLDCSGYVRMVWGYRNKLPLVLDPNGVGLPRRAHQMLSGGPGVVTRANTGSQLTSFTTLAPGDLVFFDAALDDGTAIDHVGMYLGVDSTGHQRFISSRKTADGPTLGDLGGSSRLDGSGFYAKAYRANRRL